MSQYPNPRVDADALVIHADRMASMSGAERADYLSDFAGRRTPPPDGGYQPDERGLSIADQIGAGGVAALIIKADAAKAAKGIA